MESDEHIYFKNLIAEIGNRLGYSVALEKRIRTEGTQKLIADVFLEKGNAKIVVEVQSSPQIRDDFKIRQDSYMKAVSELLGYIPIRMTKSSLQKKFQFFVTEKISHTIIMFFLIMNLVTKNLWNAYSQNK